MKAISSSESLIDPAIEGFGTGGINPLGVATILCLGYKNDEFEFKILG